MTVQVALPPKVYSLPAGAVAVTALAAADIVKLETPEHLIVYPVIEAKLVPSRVPGSVGAVQVTFTRLRAASSATAVMVGAPGAVPLKPRRKSV